MEEYYFLFLIAFVYTIFAAVQDLKEREVANWLNFSLIAFALAYRAIYSSYTGNYSFLLFGVLGFGVFFLISNLLYYTKVFAGGDAKLLMAFGAILPFQSYLDLATLSLSFLFVLFFIGMIYGAIYSIFLAATNKTKFSREFREQFRKRKYLLLFSILGIAIIIAKSFGVLSYLPSWWFFALLFIFMPLLYIYLEAVNRSCMIKIVDASKLTVGDWLEQNVKIGSKTIRKSVHCLSASEIKALQKARKKVIVRYGIPFVPAFLLALIFMVFFFLVSGLDFQSFFSSLF